MTKPNIILIMTDQLRADCLGYMGHPDVKTPYLDSLAAQGVVFSALILLSMLLSTISIFTKIKICALPLWVPGRQRNI